MNNPIKAEPALLMGAFGSFLSLLVTFGVRLSGHQIDLIMAIAGAVLPLVLMFGTRALVYSPAKVEKMMRGRL